MTKSVEPKTPPFVRSFQKRYADSGLPTVYTQFISDRLYLEYKGTFVTGLPGDDPSSAVKLRFDDREMLDRETFFDDHDIDLTSATSIYPLATLKDAPQFLALDISVRECPVLVWEHETGEFTPIAQSLKAFVGSLLTKEAVQEIRKRKRAAESALRKIVTPLQKKLVKAFAQGNHQELVALFEERLSAQEPVPYTGQNSFELCGALAACFNLNGLSCLALGEPHSALLAFEKAYECGGKSGNETFVNTVVMQCRLGKIAEAVALERRNGAIAYIGEKAWPIVATNFPDGPGEGVLKALTEYGKKNSKDTTITGAISAWWE